MSSALEYLKQEPLAQHPTYEKIANLPSAEGCQTQVARKKQTGEYVSIKFLPRGYDAEQTTRLIRCTVNHMELSTSLHPHVVLYKETFLTPHYLAMVTEYIEGETIESFLEKVGGKVIEGLARFIFQQLCIAVDFCHQQCKILRDIKLSNVLLSIAEGQLPLLKLCDFSVSKDMSRDSDPHSQEGSILYAAPEVLQNAGGGYYDGQAADIWACGIILYVMLFGRHPFLRDQDSCCSQDQKMVAMLQRTITADAELPDDIVNSLSPACMDLLARIIQVDPQQRITMQQMKMHPWFLEALPEGASAMNRLFLADSLSLSASNLASIQSLIQTASASESDPAVVALHAQLAQADPSSHAQLIANQWRPWDTPTAVNNTTTSGNASVTAMSSVMTPLPHAYQPQQQQPPYLIEQLQGGPGPDAPRVGEQLQPQQQQCFLQSQSSGLKNLEEAIMTMPSGQLKTAAVEDILQRDYPRRLESLTLNSPIAPRTTSEFERSLMGSSSFMREFIQAGISELRTSSKAELPPVEESPAASDTPGGIEASAPEAGERSKLIVDASPFLYDGPSAETGQLPPGLESIHSSLPHASFSAMNGSFDFRSFNNMFSTAELSTGSMSQLAMPSALESAWARMSRDVSVKAASDPALHSVAEA